MSCNGRVCCESGDTGHKPELLLIFIISKYLSIIISSALGLWQYLQMDHIPPQTSFLLLYFTFASLSGARSPELTSSIGKLRAIAWAAWAGWIGGRRGLSGTNYSGSGAFYREGGTGTGVQRRIKLSVARWRLRVMYHHRHCDQRGENSHKSRWKYTPRQPFGVS